MFNSLAIPLFVLGSLVTYKDSKEEKEVSCATYKSAS